MILPPFKPGAICRGRAWSDSKKLCKKHPHFARAICVCKPAPGRAFPWQGGLKDRTAPIPDHSRFYYGLLGVLKPNLFRIFSGSSLPIYFPMVLRKAPGGSSIMGSGSLSRKMLVQFPDVFLLSPQFLHRAFSLSNKVNNKCQ